jgi:hypothetical protein
MEVPDLGMELSSASESVAMPPTPSETPSPTPAPVTPEAVPATEATPEPKADPAPAAIPETKLYELPDGRKVDAATLQKEWSQNFLPDYTRKSQELARMRNTPPAPDNQTKDINKDDVPEWKKPDYQPETYADVIEIATKEAMARIQSQAEASRAQEQAIEERVNSEINAIKASDPAVNEGALFAHANRYGFTDLKAAHKNMQDMRAAMLETEQRVLKNIKTRDADPVSTAASGANVSDDSYDPQTLSEVGSALEFLSRIKSK